MTKKILWCKNLQEETTKQKEVAKILLRKFYTKMFCDKIWWKISLTKFLVKEFFVNKTFFCWNFDRRKFTSKRKLCQNKNENFFHETKSDEIYLRCWKMLKLWLKIPWQYFGGRKFLTKFCGISLRKSLKKIYLRKLPLTENYVNKKQRILF